MLLLPTWLPSLGPLVLADLRRRYAGSLLGALWAVLGPVLEVAAYAVVFGWILGAAGRTEMPYALLIASGLFPWISFREALEGSASVLPDNRWVRRSRVPMQLLVARQVLTAAPRAVVSLVVVFAFAAVSGRIPSLVGIASPFLALALQAVGSYGLGLLVAPLTTLFPDLRPSLVSLLTLLTFASPILYPESAARGAVQTLLLCNPFTHLLRLYRSPVEALSVPSTLVSVGVALVAALAALALGRLAQRRLWWKARDLL